MSENFKRQIILQYCDGFHQIYTVSEKVVYKSSQDIQDELSTIADISLDDIASVFVELGYKLVVAPDGRPAWMLEPK